METLAMKAHLLPVTMSALFLACVAIPATAQQPSGGEQRQTEQTTPDHDSMMGRGMMGGGMMGHGGMMGRRGMGGGMMGGHRGMMNLPMRIIFALMDTDGDGTISLQEWQAAHEKIFKAMDTDHDGTVTLGEMEAFIHGGKKSAPQH